MTTIPASLGHKRQCIETCRLDSAHKFSSYDTTTKACTCIKSNNMNGLPSPAEQLPPVSKQDCSNYRYIVSQKKTRIHMLNPLLQYWFLKVHELANVPQALDCMELYYSRQVYVPGEYVTTEGKLFCGMSETPRVVAGNYQQRAEKMARAALIFPYSTDPGLKIQSLGNGVSREIKSGSCKLYLHGHSHQCIWLYERKCGNVLTFDLHTKK